MTTADLRPSPAARGPRAPRSDAAATDAMIDEGGPVRGSASEGRPLIVHPAPPPAASSRTYRREGLGGDWHIVPGGVMGGTAAALCGATAVGGPLLEGFRTTPPPPEERVCPRCVTETHWAGAEVVLAAGGGGRVQGVLRDPASGRVRRLVTAYVGDSGEPRRVAVPLEWVVRERPGRVVLGVGTRELDQLPAHDQASVPGHAAPPGGGDPGPARAAPVGSQSYAAPSAGAAETAFNSTACSVRVTGPCP